MNAISPCGFRGKRLLVALTLLTGGLLSAQQSSPQAQAPSDVSKLPYMDPSLPIDQRVDYLLGHMTPEEKVTQLVNQSRAVPRLGIPAYDWWSESLHGVLLNGTTEYPEPIGLAATFDTKTIHQMAIAIGVEGRIKHAQAVRAGHSNIFEGLDFWAPNINIFRDPRWGRGQETYGEDPFLTARMGVAFVTGMQGDDPKYYRVIATPKHYAVHSGPEPTRHTADVSVSKHDELDTYLPAFRATVTEGKAGSVMCAYNAINGEPACVNQFLLEDQLRGKWNFQGYVVSDCGAVVNIFQDHHFTKTQAESSALAVQRGMDNECIDFLAQVTDDHDYKPYLDAFKQGILKESEIDTVLRRLLTARMKLGMFDPPEMVPYSKIDEQQLDSADHQGEAVVHVAPTLRGEPHEALLLLRWADSATSARGYECLFSFDGGFDIVRWNGPYGDFTSIGQEDARLGRTLATGDVLRARIVGPAITCFVNDAQVGHATDATWRDGQPGIGFFRREAGENADIAFSSYTATSVRPG